MSYVYGANRLVQIFLHCIKILLTILYILVCRYNGQTWLQGDMMSNQLYKSKTVRFCSETYCESDGKPSIKDIECGKYTDLL